MATKVALQMDFLTDLNKKVRITVQNPVQPLDSTAVGNVMDLIVSKGIFAFPQGLIVKKVGATQVDTNSTAII